MAFSIPTLKEIKEGNKIQSENKPTLFKYKTKEKDADLPPTSSSLPSTSSISEEVPTISHPRTESQDTGKSHETTEQATMHQPHAILVNSLQVSMSCFFNHF